MLQLFSIFAIFTLILFLSFSEVNGELTVHDDDYIIEKFATGIDFPTTMDFVGNDLLVLEKNTGKIIRINENGEIDKEPVLIDVRDWSNEQEYIASSTILISPDAESGLLGIATTTDNVFLYFTESGKPYGVYQGSKNVVYQYDWNGENLINPILIKELPAIGDTHNGGVFAKGQDNELYFVIGDNEHVSDFQNFPSEITRETSSIFKIHTDDDNRVELFAMGIRNSFGLDVDPITGHLWQTENGVNEYDEINLVKPGFNSGWRILMGPADRDWLWNIDINPNRTFSTSIEHDEAILQIIPQSFKNFVYSDPEFSWFTSNGVTSIAFPDLNSFAKYRDWLFVGDFNHGKIYKFQLNSDRTEFIFSHPGLKDLVLDPHDLRNHPEIMKEFVFAEFPGGITDIKFTRDTMYVVVPFADGYGENTGAIYKIYSNQAILPPLKQYNAGASHDEISCKPGLMPVMRNSGYIICVYPETASILINRTGFTEIVLTDVHLPDKDLTNTDLTGVDLSGKDLTNADLTGVDLSGKDLTNADLTGVDLSGKDLTGTILTGADLTGADLTGVDLTDELCTINSTNQTDDSSTNTKNCPTIELTSADFSEKASDIKNTPTLIVTFTVTNPSDLPVIIPVITYELYANGNLLGSGLYSTEDSREILEVDVLAPFKVIPEKKGQLESWFTVILTDENQKEYDAIASGEQLEYDIIIDEHWAVVGKDLTGTVLHGANLTNADLTGVDLSGKDLRNVDFTNVDLRGLNLGDAILVDVDLSGKDLTGTNLTNSVLTIEELSSVKDLSCCRYNFSNSNLTDVDLSGKDLSKIFFSGADLSNKDLTGTNLSEVNLSNMDLSNTVLRYADLNNVNLTNVDLSGKDLTGTVLTGANLTNVNLTSVDLSNKDFSRTVLTNANLSDTDLTSAIFVDSKDLNGVILSNADLTNANLTGVDLSNTDLTSANLTGADLTNANLTNAQLENTILDCINHEVCLP